MALSRDTVKQVAVLARLRLTPEEECRLTAELDSILGYMEKLNQLDTEHISPFSHAMHTVNVLREDRITNRPEPEVLLANAPDRDATFFKVPKIIE